MECTKCGSQELRRMERQGWLEQKVYSAWGYFPWECTECRSKLILKHRGEKKPRPTQVFPRGAQA